MVEFNLLPDIKMQFLRTKRLEHLVVTVSIIVAGIAVVVLIFLAIFVEIGQRTTLNNLTSQINSSSAKLSSSKNLNEILTVQKQLQTLPQLEAQSPTVSRLFSFISQLTPVNVTISSLNISYSTNSVTITGGADTLATVNTYVDTLKYAAYNDETTNTTKNPAFNTVVLASFNYSNANSGNGASPAQYSIAFNFDPTLFNSTDKITLVVPTEITTRSILNQPDLFKAEPTSSSSTKG